MPVKIRGEETHGIKDNSLILPDEKYGILEEIKLSFTKYKHTR